MKNTRIQNNISKYCEINNIEEKDEYYQIAINSLPIENEFEDIKFNEIHLEIACKFSNIDTIRDILNQKINPTRKSFLNFLSRINSDRLERCISLYTAKREINDIPELNLLLMCGYMPSQDDFLEIIKKNIYINDYEKYGLKIDDKIVETCNNNWYFPYESMKTPIIMALISFYNTSTLKNLETVIKKYNIMPDIRFLKVACDRCTNNAKIVRHISNTYNLEPDLECIYLATKCGDKALRDICQLIKSFSVK